MDDALVREVALPVPRGGERGEMEGVGAGMRTRLRIREDVREALNGGAPVVALESTIVAHGMPYPQNLETAMRLESVVRCGGRRRGAAVQLRRSDQPN